MTSEKNESFSIGDDVIFIDEPYGTSISMNGRLGKIVSVISMSDDNDDEILYGVEFSDKAWEHDEAWAAVAPRYLRKADMKIPEVYALYIAYKCYSPYDKSNFSSDDLMKLAEARDQGLLDGILKEGE